MSGRREAATGLCDQVPPDPEGPWIWHMTTLVLMTNACAAGAEGPQPRARLGSWNTPTPPTEGFAAVELLRYFSVANKAWGWTVDL